MKLKGLSKNGGLTDSESNTSTKIYSYEKVELLQYYDIKFVDTNKL